MDELDGQRVKLFTDDPGLWAPSLAEAINLEGQLVATSEMKGSAVLTSVCVSPDCHYAQLQADLEWDAHNLEAESWSLAVDQNYLMSMNKEAGKRQDVIYGTLKQKLIQNVCKPGYDAWLEKLFPSVEVLLSLHMHFFNFLKLRQKQSQDEENPNNFCIAQLGDILINQDNKPPVIFLQRVIVREVAHEEKGMYIICASTSGLAGMYELHTGSKDECQTWMNLIREAVD
ncbi:hypothetical protein GOODEAATRI_002062, partial [Goodea atripinnis]